MPRMELVIHVVAGTARTLWCDTCQTSEGYEADVFALVASGLQQLGTIAGCGRCDLDAGVIRCHYCPAVLADAGVFWRHMAARHGEAVT